MKKILFILLSCILFNACSNDSNDEIPEKIKLSHSSCTLDQENQYVAIDILNGSGKYKLETDNDEIVTMRWSTTTEHKFFIIARQEGNTNIKINDEHGNVSTIRVTVSEPIHQPIPVSELIYIKKGENKILNIPNSFDFASTNHFGGIIDIDNNYSDRLITVWAKNIGESQLSVSDVLSVRHIFDIKIVDSYDLLLNRGDTFLSVYNKDYYFHILTGNGSYQITLSDNTLGKCELMEYMGDKTLNILSNPATIKVSGMKAGKEFDITIKDADNKTKTINIKTGFFVSNTKKG